MSALICSAEIDYSSNKQIKEMGAEEFSALVHTLTNIGFTITHTQEDWPDWYSMSAVCFVEDVRSLQQTYPWLSITAKRMRGQFVEGPEFDPKNVMGSTQITNISIPSAGLYEVQTVHWLENVCTETLQSYLDDGWRIIAVCPPNDTRRPTYILGHADKNRPKHVR